MGKTTRRGRKPVSIARVENDSRVVTPVGDIEIGEFHRSRSGSVSVILSFSRRARGSVSGSERRFDDREWFGARLQSRVAAFSRGATRGSVVMVDCVNDGDTSTASRRRPARQRPRSSRGRSWASTTDLLRGSTTCDADSQHQRQLEWERSRLHGRCAVWGVNGRELGCPRPIPIFGARNDPRRPTSSG